MLNVSEKILNILIIMVVATIIIIALGFTFGFVPSDIQPTVAEWMKAILGFGVGLFIQKK